MTGHNIDLIALDFTIKRSGLLLGNEALPQVRGHVLRIIFIQSLVPGQFAGLDRFKPMKYRHRIQTRNG